MSAVIVTPPECDEVVRAHRARMDRSATWGVPAHVTVLFPFLAPDQIDASVLERLATAVSSVETATTTFEETGWFGTDVLWLAPSPPTPFSRLTSEVAAAFPGYPPYGGAFDGDVPHLTVGQHVSHAELRAAEAAILPLLPVTSEITQAALWCGSDAPASWSQRRTFSLG